MVLAATNRPSELDEAILRRLPQAFEIGYPDQKERAEILKVILKGERVEDNIDFGYIAGLCKGYTGSDLFDLCKKAAYFPIRELLDDEKKGKQSCVSIFVILFYFLICLNFLIFLVVNNVLFKTDLARLYFNSISDSNQCCVCLFYLKLKLYSYA
jgi:SpoVK/Ycf46/Vps4 family AAA+-type ATPase